MRIYVIAILYLIGFFGFSQVSQNSITGTVTDGAFPLYEVNVKIKDAESGVTTNENGKYGIRAQAGDILVFSFVGKQTVEIIVEDVTKILNIELLPFFEELDEVVVSKRKNRYTQKDLSIAYAIDSTIVNTSLGYLNPDTAFFEFYTLSGEDLKGSMNFIEAIRRKISGVRVLNQWVDVNRSSEQRLYLTPRTNIKAIFEVDGNLMLQTPILNVDEITRIGIMYGNQAEQRFGKIALGGVVFINTKNGLHGAREGNTKLPYDRAKLRNNIYREDAVTKKNAHRDLPDYLKALQEASSFLEAKNLYLKFEVVFRNVPYFFIDAYSYFMKQGYLEFAADIYSEQLSKINQNPVWLKAWAYYLEAANQSDLATTLFERIYKLRPNYVQSYLDLANSYRSSNQDSKAGAIYARYDYLVNQGMLKADSVGVSNIVKREADNLVKHVNDRLEVGKKLDDFMSNLGDTRLVFEWNDSEAEFELQFVNPQKQYHTWQHTREDNQNRINDEKIKGYSCEEFFIDDSLPGTWKVNINYLGNKKLGPTYLKVSTYYNYGMVSQRKEISVYRLGLKDVNQELFSL